MRVLKIKIRGKLFAKFTTEELNGHKYISTYWDVTYCLEEDREVKQFETYSGALVHMYATAVGVLSRYSGFETEEQ